jgi:hypothetical protein
LVLSDCKLAEEAAGKQWQQCGGDESLWADHGEKSEALQRGSGMESGLAVAVRRGEYNDGHCTGKQKTNNCRMAAASSAD